MTRLPLAVLICVFLLVVYAFHSPRVHKGASPSLPAMPPGGSQTTPDPCVPGSPAYYTCHLPEAMYLRQGPFDRALRAKSDHEGLLYVSIVDGAVLDMATNLYLSSYKRHGIDNFLFVCTDKESIHEFTRLSISCFDFRQDWIDASGYKTQAEVFKRKTHLKTKVVLSALLLGYTIVMTDVDMVFLKPPNLFIKKYLDEFDMQFIEDGGDPSTAFYVVRPTSGSLEAHKMALAEEIPHQDGVTDRRVMLSIVHVLSVAKKLKVRNLDTLYFQDGKTYYETGMRMFYSDNICQVCVAVHNNWVFSQSSKIYRMKENLFWHVDSHGYYSSTGAKYLVYNNPLSLEDPMKTVQLEMKTLKDALTIAFLLKRILILPTFHCGHCENDACHNINRQCALNTYLNIHLFDLYLKGYYREHSFLANPLVPDIIRRYTSRPILIYSKQISLDTDASNIKHVYTPDNPVKGAEPPEVIKWFTQHPFDKYSILHFHSLYGAFAGISHKAVYREDPEYREFHRKLIVGFRQVNYRQLRVNHKDLLLH